MMIPPILSQVLLYQKSHFANWDDKLLDFLLTVGIRQSVWGGEFDAINYIAIFLSRLLG